MDQVLDDHDETVLDMKIKAEEMWEKCSTKRERRTTACSDVPGFCFFGDNIGMFLVWTKHDGQTILNIIVYYL